MNGKKQRLELTWIGKDEGLKLEPRILVEDPQRSYGDPRAENILIHGDNLLALKALEQQFAGKIKCIYIDPPYNTGNAFEHYDDSLEHSIWLSLMRNRLELLRGLLLPNGFICCHIDDAEGHYLKVLMDEVFGRSNYLTTFYIQVRYPEKTLKQDMDFHKEIEQVHIYRRDYGAEPNLNQTSSSYEKFCFYINEKGPGRKIVLGGKNAVIFKPGEYEIVEGEGGADGLKEIWATGTILDGNSSGRFFRDYLAGRTEADGLGALYKVDGIGDDKFSYRYFTGPKRAGATKGKYYQGVPNEQLENPNQQQFSPIENFYDLAAYFGNCRHEGGVEFRSGKKPEHLLGIILKHFSNPGDWVLDSFLGSGSTAAVAHKMGRKWIGVELGEHANTHCVSRLKLVVDGTDQSGVSELMAWKGGGGFKFYELAPSLLRKDKFGNWVIDEKYNANMLAAAMCKHEGFIFFPDVEIYWKQGKSTESDYIFVTTAFMTVEQLDKIHSEMKNGESLLICAKSFAPACKERHGNITIKKIPQLILGKCEFGKDNYDLNIVNALLDNENEDFDSDEQMQDEKPKSIKGKKDISRSTSQKDLFKK